MEPLAQLYDLFLNTHPIVRELEQRVLSCRLPHSVCMSAAQAEYDQKKANIYFRLYTIPVLECAGFITPDQLETAVLWGKVQFSMGMHIRYLDTVIDGDTQHDSYNDLQLAHFYLLEAIRGLGTLGHTWDVSAQAFYCQYLHYESEIRAGHRHTFASLWRRVSPLCVIPEVCLVRRLTQSDMQWFRHYLSWSLLYADCADVFDDMNRHTTTPISRLVREAYTHTYHDAQIAADIVKYMRNYLSQQCRLLESSIQPRYPLWSMCVTHMQNIHGDPLMRRYS